MSSPFIPFWEQVRGEFLPQGDLLPNCPIPVFPAEFGAEAGAYPVNIVLGDLVVVTQSRRCGRSRGDGAQVQGGSGDGVLVSGSADAGEVRED
jgi:hypothetical protein